MKDLTWQYIEYCSLSATSPRHKSTLTSSFLATVADLNSRLKFISCHYAVQFLNLELSYKLQILEVFKRMCEGFSKSRSPPLLTVRGYMQCLKPMQRCKILNSKEAIMFINSIAVDQNKYVQVSIYTSQDKLWCDLSVYYKGPEGNYHETGDGIVIDVGLIHGLVDVLSDIEETFPSKDDEHLDTLKSAFA
jgi:hypothetical protein